jgi:hypothetical protein
MQALTGYVIGAAIVLALAGLASRWHWGSKRMPLIVWVIGAAIAWTVILGLAWFIGGLAQFSTVALVCFGFALGMLSSTLPCTSIRHGKSGISPKEIPPNSIIHFQLGGKCTYLQE